MALHAARKKTSTKKSATKKLTKQPSPREDLDDDDKGEVVNLKKAEFVSAVAAKTGMTKADSEMALAAVLNVIMTVSFNFDGAALI